MDALRICAEHSNLANASALEQALYAHNRAASGHEHWQAVLFCLRDKGDTLQGGLSGYLWGGWLHIAILWVHEGVRGRGFGAQLLAAAEAYALAHNCPDAHLSTFAFQAPEFYRKHGYVCFGELQDCPRGYVQYFMRKRLSR